MLGDDDEVAFDIDEPDSESEQRPSKNSKRKQAKKKLKELPTFASAEDYAKLLDNEPDDV